MSVTITVTGNAPRRLANRVQVVAAGVRLRLARELREELQSIGASDRDPEARRDALERAVRRWGQTLRV